MKRALLIAKQTRTTQRHVAEREKEMDIEEKVINNVISVLEEVRLLQVAQKTEEDFVSRVLEILDDAKN